MAFYTQRLKGRSLSWRAAQQLLTIQKEEISTFWNFVTFLYMKDTLFLLIYEDGKSPKKIFHNKGES